MSLSEDSIVTIRDHKIPMKDGKPDFSICWECGQPNNWEREPCRSCWESGLKSFVNSRASDKSEAKT